MDEHNVNRRRLLMGGVLIGTAGALGVLAQQGARSGVPSEIINGVMPWRDGAADVPTITGGTEYRYFTADEQAFIEPAIDRIIPIDPTGPSATEANVHIFLDRQMAGSYGRGDHFYLGGPWPKGTPEQGYQSRLTPAQLYRVTISAIEEYIKRNYDGKTFKQLSVTNQDTVLKGLQDGTIALDSTDGKTFFTMFLQNVLEGYFSDPIYGGNKDMAAWKMIGFPGTHYDYREWVERHGEQVPYATVGIKGRPGWSES